MSRQAGPRYPYAPLEAQVAARLADASLDVRAEQAGHDNDVRQAEMLGTNRHQIARWRRYGVSALQADRLAQRIHLDPYQLWPEMLDAAIAEVERQCAAEACTNTFTLKARAPHQRFCSSNCRAREGERARYRRSSRKKIANRRYKAEVRAAIQRRSERSAA